MDAGDLVGMSPRRGLAANTPIRIHDVERPIDVARGDTVVMPLQSGALMIPARGRALDQGSLGQVVRVLNVDSNRPVEAVVTGPNARPAERREGKGRVDTGSTCMMTYH